MPDDPTHQPSSAQRPPIARTIYLDVKDLLDYAAANARFSGIQRVVANLARAIAGWTRDNPGVAVRLVAPEYEVERLITVDLDATLALIGLVENQDGNPPLLKDALRAVYATRTLVRPQAGDIYLMAGAFWSCETFDFAVRLRETGVLFGLFLHDLLQLSRPDFVDDDMRRQFRIALLDALAATHFLMANSHYVAGELRSFLAERLNFTLPVRAVPLATELPQPAVPEGQIDTRAKDLPQRGFVLCVGTLDVRKNQIYLARIWERLLAEAPDTTPDLVFVGKWGWKAGELRRFIQAGRLAGRVHLFEQASDATLRYLYETCLLTAYPSLAEGFGLPVGESLAYGRPCVAADTTSLPEVGGRFARYVDPADLDDGYATFRAILSDRAAIEAWAAEIRDHYRPKTWACFGAGFFSAATQLADDVGTGQRVVNCILESGQSYRAGSEEPHRLDQAGVPLVTMRMAFASGWHRFERWGCWASRSEARLRFKADAEIGTPIALLLQLHVPLGSRAMCTVEAGGGPVALRPGPLPQYFLVPGIVGPGGVVGIGLKSFGHFAGSDGRPLFVGLHSLAWCPKAETGMVWRFRKAVTGTLHRRVLGVFASMLLAKGRPLAKFVRRPRPKPSTIGSMQIDLGAGRILTIDGEVEPEALAQLLDEFERRWPISE